MPSSLVFITGLKAEARLLAGLDCQTLVGIARLEEAIARGARALVSFGLAGGLDPALAPGALLLPGQVIWRGIAYPTDARLTAALGGANCASLLAEDDVVVKAADKLARWEGSRAAGVDMESGAVAEAAARHGLPFAVLRGVCDSASKDLPPAALVALDNKGAIGLCRVAGSVVRHPGQIVGLLGLAKDAGLARRALVRHIDGVAARGALRPWF